MDSADIAHQRLHNLRISGPALDAPEDVLRWLGAVQSQDYPGGKWSIAHRVHRWPDAELDRVFNEGKVLRTHVLRPTWHFVLPEDIRWMLELTAPRIHATNAHYARSFGVFDILAEGERIVAAALEPGEHLTRRELQAVLGQHGMAVSGLGLAYVLMHAELNAVICSGALRGKQQTYALVEQRAPAARRLARDEALAELTRRFFGSHGPATVNDFNWWSTLTVADIKRGLDMLGARLEHATVNGTTYWFDPTAQPQRAMSPSLHLLQGYDEYFVGYSGESKAVLDLSNAARTQADVRGALTHVVVLDSQVIGRWQRSVTTHEVRIQAELFHPLEPPAQAALEDSAKAYGEFMRLPAVLT